MAMTVAYETYTVGSGDGFIRDLSTTPATPLPIGVVMDFSLSQALETTELPTQNITPEAGALVGAKYTAKFKVGGSYAAQLRALAANATKTAGMEIVKAETKAHVSGALTLTDVTGFQKTLAVYDSYNHLMSPVASGPVASTTTVPGTYIDVGAGVYTFQTAQPGQPTVKWLKLDSTTGFIVSPNNATQGAAATFVEVVFAYKAKKSDGSTVDETIRIPQGMITKLDQSAKPKAANQFDVELDVFCDGNGKPWYRSVAL
jgi:hypothetical protein